MVRSSDFGATILVTSILKSSKNIGSTWIFLFYNAQKTIMNKIIKTNYIFTELNNGSYFMAEGFQEENEYSS